MLTIIALNSYVISRANENNSQEYDNFLMLKYENILSEIRYSTKNDSKFIPRVDDDKTSANMPKINAESRVKASLLKLSQK